MSLKQLVSPRKSKKRPYRRRVRNKTQTNINCSELGIETSSPTHNKQKSLLTINTDIIGNTMTPGKSTKPLKSPRGPPPVPSRNVISHSRTLSSITMKKPTIQTTHSRLTTPLTPITIDASFPSPISPYSVSHKPPHTQKASQNTNYLSFTEATQKFSVSLPSSPVEATSNATKNMRYKMQRFSSASNIEEKT
eukprot:374716_1